MMLVTVLKAFVMMLIGAVSFYVAKWLAVQGEAAVCMSSWGAGKVFYDWFPFLVMAIALFAAFRIMNPPKQQPPGYQQPSVFQRIGGLFGGGRD